MRVQESETSTQESCLKHLSKALEEVPSSPLLPSHSTVAWFMNRKIDGNRVLSSSPISPCLVKPVTEDDDATDCSDDDHSVLGFESQRLDMEIGSSPLSSPINNASITNVRHALRYQDQNKVLPPRPVFKGFATKSTK